MRLPGDRFEFIPCGGGCDFITPPLLQRAGRLRECINFEIGITGGYDTLTGYERYDGQASPSAATYTVLPVNITGTVSVGNTVTGAISGATGKVIAVEAEAIIVTLITGSFNSTSENLTVTMVVQATMTGSAVQGGASTTALNSSYKNLAADAYRALILVVPGEGPIRGVCRFNSVLYAWRNNVGSTEMVIHKSSAAGWVSVPLGKEIEFTGGGTYVIAEGDTITGATSGATAAITRVVLRTGTWETGDAAGYLVFASQTGVFVAENLDVGANLDVATIAGNSANITLLPSGRVKTYLHNFGGTAATRRIYGCDGVNYGFEFDGSIYVRIRTGMVDDEPRNVFCHKNHLFYSFAASVQHSGTTLPYEWSPVVGAGEIGVGDIVTGFSTEMGSTADAALGIMSRNSVHLLYGNDASDWNLIKYRDEIGAYENSIQNIGHTVTMDDRGVTALRAAQEFGNFANSTLSQNVQPWLLARQLAVTDSCIVRSKGQYRIFFEDSSALYMTFSGSKILGLMTEQLDHKVTSIHSVEASDGSDEIFFGSSDGYCYQMERGTSFDGNPIRSYAMFEYFNCKSPRAHKTFKGATVEAAGSGYSLFTLGYELGYSSPDIAQPPQDLQAQVNFLEGRWDIGNWDVGYWDGVSISPNNFKIVGTAENISFILYINSDEQPPIRFSGILVRFLPRRIMR